MRVRFNRWADFAERVGWTAIQAGIGAAIDYLATGDVTWRAVLFAAMIAAGKVLAGQHLGPTPDGSLSPVPPVEPVEK